MGLQKLEWDSRFFEIPVYALRPLDSTGIDELNVSGERRLVYVFVEEGNNCLIERLEGLGAELIDTRIIYRKELNEANLPELFKEVREYEGELTDELEVLAWQAGSFSRFHKDNRLLPYFKGLYSRWIINSLNKRIADKVFVLYDEESIGGVATCKLKEGQGWLGLISVSESFQGKGAGSQLLSAVEQFYIVNGVRNSWVITQKGNLKACSFYESSGYSVQRRELIFHLWQD